MAAFVRNEKLDEASRIGLLDCVSCGGCSYICPSHIPLVHFFNYAKGRLNAQDRERRKRDLVKTLVEARSVRLDKQAQAKREAAAAAAAAAAAKNADANRANP